MKLGKITVLLLLDFLSVNVLAEGFSAGVTVSYLSGTSELSDLLESNLDNDPNMPLNLRGDADVDVSPIGFSFRGKYQTSFGLRTDLGVGPIIFALDSRDDGLNSDFSYFELPVSATVGYNFLPQGDLTPFIRAGLGYHIVDGDNDIGANVGLVAAVGLEFSRNNRIAWGLEVGVDNSSIEFIDLANFNTAEINTVDKFLSVYFLYQFKS